ncbi:N-acetylmuramoyl-L-alanine amidase family protein [Clostridium transplantifaecale]|uniref:N-acetylmuramoyl-L-alanine amidase family protein n=1 Tax=Clostridium transplantifaecale TaxID=2479838 RepID=UPI000F6394EF|nr:N-acetylmuramoyl-L-alanine amidase family protein [Clostridium transplantifaecale]
MHVTSKKIWTGIIAAGLALLCAGPCFAARKPETRTPITFIRVDVRSNVEADTDYDEATVMITTTDNQYEIGSYEWVKPPKDSWKIGDVPKIKINIHAKTGYYFKVTGSSKYQITGGEYGSASKDKNYETLYLTVKLQPASGKLDEPDDAEWKGYPVGKADWEAVEGAGAYELKLFKGEQIIHSVDRVSTTFYDFHPYITEAGRYKFCVRAVPKDSEELKYMTSGDWVYSDELRVDADETSPFVDNGAGATPSGQNMTPNDLGWRHDKNGWWYRNADGSYPAGDWAAIDGKWYLFDGGGYILTGWQSKNGKKYYMNSNGEMQTGWLELDKQWYLLGDSGEVQTGWANINGNLYYMDGDGRMQTGWLLNNGNWYYLNPSDGSMMRNVTIDGRYVNADGIWANR